jgi:3-isopropylmalate dehydrogenase
MALRYSFSRIEDANLLEKAISSVLESGLRTKDISTNDSKGYINIRNG